MSWVCTGNFPVDPVDPVVGVDDFYDVQEVSIRVKRNSSAVKQFFLFMVSVLNGLIYISMLQRICDFRNSH